MRKEYARRHHQWHSLKLQYVSARVDDAVARIDRRSRATLSEIEMGTETMEDFVDRIARDVGREDHDDGQRERSGRRTRKWPRGIFEQRHRRGRESRPAKRKKVPSAPGNTHCESQCEAEIV